MGAESLETENEERGVWGGTSPQGGQSQKQRPRWPLNEEKQDRGQQKEGFREPSPQGQQKPERGAAIYPVSEGLDGQCRSGECHGVPTLLETRDICRRNTTPVTEGSPRQD